MDSEKFVHAIEQVVLASAVKGTQDILETPPGRSPAQDLLELSLWYKSLSEQDRKMIIKIISKSASNAVFGFFCVLDGVRVFEDGPDKGDLNLYYERNSESVLLNSPKEDFLHEMMSRL